MEPKSSISIFDIQRLGNHSGFGLSKKLITFDKLCPPLLFSSTIESSLKNWKITKIQAATRTKKSGSPRFQRNPIKTTAIVEIINPIPAGIIKKGIEAKSAL